MKMENKMVENAGVYKKPNIVHACMNREELDAELMKGVESLKAGRIYTADEVDTELAREFGI